MIELNMVKFDTGLVTTNDSDKAILNQIPEGEFVNIKIQHGKSRSLEQNNLYWAACNLIADNTEDNNFNTSEKVSEQCKIHCKFFDCYVYYNNVKTGQQTLNVKTKSISFQNCNTDEANAFFTDAFKYLANLMKMDVETFVSKVKSEMCIQKITKEFNGTVVK